MIALPPKIQGADLPDDTIAWLDRNGDIIDFSSGYTFELRLGTPGTAATLTKTTGITGASTSPNLTIAWSTSGELNTLTPGTHTGHLIATRTSDSKQRILELRLAVRQAISS